MTTKTQLKSQSIEYHQYIIIGAGISGLMSGIILAQHDKDFIILEASDTVGGRVRTEKLSQVIKRQDIKKQWFTREILDTNVEVGATWIAKQHSYILKLIQEYEFTLFPQYSDGLSVYGVNEKKYQKVETIATFFKQYQKQLLNLVNKIQNLTLNMYEISNSIKMSSSQNSLLEEYIKYYDSITVSKFIRQQISDPELADMIMNQMQTLQCISCDNFSVLQLIDDDGCMQLLKLYCDKVDDNIDVLKVKQGMVAIMKRMAQQIYDIFDENESQHYTGVEKIIRLNQPVVEIQNQLGEDVIIRTKDGKVYSCMKVLFTVPIAVASQIKISRISPSKKMIFENQEYGSVTRFYFIFPTAFWRGKYNGYCSFSRKFPFNELTELSPPTLACGILAFVFVHNKFQMWEQELGDKNPDCENILQMQIKYMLKTLTDMFLDGNINSPQIKDYFTYKRSFKQLPYIRAAYQTTTKPEVWKNIIELGDDYGDSYSRDEYNIIYIGSELGDAEDYSSYMQGGARVARQKVFRQLGKKDPWQKQKANIIPW